MLWQPLPISGWAFRLPSRRRLRLLGGRVRGSLLQVLGGDVRMAWLVVLAVADEGLVSKGLELCLELLVCGEVFSVLA